MTLKVSIYLGLSPQLEMPQKVWGFLSSPLLLFFFPFMSRRDKYSANADDIGTVWFHLFGWSSGLKSQWNFSIPVTVPPVPCPSTPGETLLVKGHHCTASLTSLVHTASSFTGSVTIHYIYSHKTQYTNPLFIPTKGSSYLPVLWQPELH